MSSLTRQIRKNQRRLAGRNPKNPKGAERLVFAAIRRDGVVHTGERSHSMIRDRLGDEDPYRPTCGDEDGFHTSGGRFVSREEAKIVGEASGQTRPQRRELLSSDIIWDAGR